MPGVTADARASVDGMADDQPDGPSEEEFRDMLRDFLAGNSDLDPARLASAAGLPDDPELVQRLIGQLQQALQNSTEGINWGLALEQAKGLAARSAVPAMAAIIRIQPTSGAGFFTGVQSCSLRA